MSEVYVHEPATRGKVTLLTTYGALDVELWSKECPKACRNFVQLCLEGYYDNTIFHRIIPDFIVQAGDPTGTGDGGQSIYGDASFPNEFHSRLKYRYRGIVGVANRSNVPNSNGSQFFITLARTDLLNNKHTIFGKVTGESLYNLMNIGAVQCDSSDRPLQPPKIKSTEVLWNPFEDIIPRELPRAKRKIENDQAVQRPQKREALKQLKTGLLSFEEETADDDNDVLQLSAQGGDTGGTDTSPTSMAGHSKMKKIKIASAHDLLVNDPVLLPGNSKPHIDEAGGDECDDAYVAKGQMAENNRQDDHKGNDDMRAKGKQTSAVFTGSTGTGQCASGIPNGETSRSKIRNLAELLEIEKKDRYREEVKLKKAILTLKCGTGTQAAEDQALVAVEDSDLLKDSDKKRLLYLSRKRDTSKVMRADITAKKLKDFESRLKSIKKTFGPLGGKSQNDNDGKDEIRKTKQTGQNEDLGIRPTVFRALPNLDEAIDEADGSWMATAGLKFSVDSSRAYEIDAAKDSLVVFDPLRGSNKKDETERARRRQREILSLKTNEKSVKW